MLHIAHFEGKLRKPRQSKAFIPSQARSSTSPLLSSSPTVANRRQAPAADFQVLRPCCKVICSKAKEDETRLACLPLEAADDCTPQADFPRSPLAPGVVQAAILQAFLWRAGSRLYAWALQASSSTSTRACKPCFFNSPDTRPTCTHWKQSKSWPSSLSMMPCHGDLEEICGRASCPQPQTTTKPAWKAEVENQLITRGCQ